MSIKTLSTLFIVIYTATLQAELATDYEVAPGSGARNNKNALIGQSFTTDPSAFAINSLDIYVNKSAFATTDFTLSLYAVTGSPENYAPEGLALYSAAYSNSLLSDSDLTDYLFADLNWTVAGGTTYLIAFESNPSQGSVRWDVATSSDSADLISGYTGQNRYIDGLGAQTGFFAMTVTTSAVPEPSTTGLLGIAVVLIALSKIKIKSNKARVCVKIPGLD